MDIFIRSDEENSRAVFRALAQYGAALDEAWKNRIEGLIDNKVRTSVISREDLIPSKLAGGREQDILDVKKLRAAHPSEPVQD